MGKSVIIAEKPSMGRTIAGYIKEKFERKDGYWESPSYIVTWCFGHLYALIDLDRYYENYKPTEKPKWSMDRLPFYPENWKFQYEIQRNASGKTDTGIKKQIQVIADLINRKDVTKIYSAGDPDQEGQAIVDNVLSYNLKSKKPVYRLWLPTLTEESVNEGLSNAKEEREYRPLYNAALARSAVDWMIGIELTRFASLKSGLFVRLGRCVCPVTQQIVEREREILNFVPEPYLGLVSKEKTKEQEILLTAKKTFPMKERDEANAYASSLNDADAIVTDVKREKKTIPSPKLFSLADAQSYMCKLDKSLSPLDVLNTIQALYEEGYVSYPRTNSNYLGDDEGDKVKEIIRAHGLVGTNPKLGNKYIYDSSKVEAHSALIPTSKVYRGTDKQKEFVYKTILNRFCAVFCSEMCEVDRTSVSIQCLEEEFKLKGEIQLKAGWRRFDGGDKKDTLLPDLKVGDKINHKFIVDEKETKPPKRYTVETLNKWMSAPFKKEDVEDEEREYTEEEYKEILSEATICTEATRADIINRCIQSKYISLRKGVYYGENSGFELVAIMDALGINLGPKRTVELSKQLHDVCIGKITKEEVYERTKEMIDEIFEADQEAPKTYRVQTEGKDPFCKCPRCGKNVYETPKSFTCENTDCGFVYWKESKYFEALGKKLSPSQIKTLIEAGKLNLKGCTSKKTGKKYDCTVWASFEERYPKYHMTFGDDNLDRNANGQGVVKDVKNESLFEDKKEQIRKIIEEDVDADYHDPSIGSCPKCGSMVVEKERFYGCTDCDFKIWKSIANKIISKKIAQQLLTHQMTELLDGFQSKKGSDFKAKLYLNSENEVKFYFE